MKLFEDKSNQVVVAISPQSVSSLGHFGKIKSDLETFKKLKYVFEEKIGAKMVIDLSLFNMLALDLTYTEFRDRYLQNHENSMKV